jgi:hypothetical protein
MRQSQDQCHRDAIWRQVKRVVAPAASQLPKRRAYDCSSWDVMQDSRDFPERLERSKESCRGRELPAKVTAPLSSVVGLRLITRRSEGSC